MRTLLVTSALVFFLLQPRISSAQTTQVISSDSLLNGWQNYSWATVDLANTSIVHGGAKSISAIARGNEGVSFHHDAFQTSPYESVRLWLNGGTGGQVLKVAGLRAGQPQGVVVLPALPANTWTQYTFTLSALGVGNVSDFDGFWLQNSTGNTLPAFYIDDVELVYAAPPSVVQLTIDPRNVIRTIDPRLYGINLTMWDSLLKSPETWQAVSALNFGALRFPGGSLSDDYDWQTNKQVTTSPNWTWANGPAAYPPFVGTNSAQAYVTVNYGSGTPEQAAAWVAYYNGQVTDSRALGTDAKSRDWKTVGYWASLRGASPLLIDDGYNHLRALHPEPFRFIYWEVGNECYGTWETDLHGVAGSGLTGVKYDPYTYAQAFKLFQAQMQAVDPSIHVGAVAVETEDDWGVKTHPATNPTNGTQHTGWTPVLLATMKSLSITPDFLIFHYYAQSEKNESDPVLLQKGFEIEHAASELRKRLNDYLGAPAATGVELAMTELNSVSSKPGKQTSNIVNGLFLADAYATVARTEFKTALWWNLHNGAETGNNNASYLYGWRTFGCYDIIAGLNYPGMPNNGALPTFWAARLLNYWGRGGDQTVAASSSYPWLTAHAAKLADGRLALLVINKHPDADLTANIVLQGFSPSGNSGAVHSFGKSIDAQNGVVPVLLTSTISNVSSSFNYTFPSYSMTVIEVPAGAQTPVITTQPANQSAALGQSITFSVSATGGAPLTYQWYKDGVALAGQTAATFTVASVQNADFGSYSVTVTNAFGSTTSSTATLSLGSADSAGVRLTNISTRSYVGTGGDILIAGFIIGGNSPKTVVIRASGPALAQFSVSGILADPTLELHQNGVDAILATNDNWGDDPTQKAAISEAFRVTKAFSWPDGSKDAAIVATLQPGGYTALVAGKATTTGVALIEVYEVDSSNTASKLVNISSRSLVQTSYKVQIAGFIVSGSGSKKVIIRASGPALTKYGVTGVLNDPHLEIHQNGVGAILAQNDNWDSALKSEFISSGIDTWTTGSKDAALILTLPAGGYTAIVNGINSTTGVALIEVYEVN